MLIRDERTQYFASDLVNFLNCRHLTTLDRFAAHRIIKRPHFDDPMLEILRARGLDHEAAYVQHLCDEEKQAIVVNREDANAFDLTVELMRKGVDVIVQARLDHGDWGGWADVLLKVDGRSKFGNWQYEPVETKLASETRGSTLIQLCLYAELLTELQGAPPEFLRVVVPNVEFVPENYRFDEYRAYFRFVRRSFESEVRKELPGSIKASGSYPDPVPHCDVCNWSSECKQRRIDDDDLSLVAGMRKLQRKELATSGVSTLRALAELPIPIPLKPNRGSVAALERLREQARLQLESRIDGTIRYELLPLESKDGLSALPTPSRLDVFLDLEGDSLAEKDGFDYLFGYAFEDDGEVVQYESMWALSPLDEKVAFERLIDMIIDRRRRDSSMRVYHYAPYEPTAMKRLMGKYATRADELDEILRAEVFVDLYRVVRKALRAGVDSYSIKKLEPIYEFTRVTDLRVASRHLRAVEYAIAKGDAASLTDEVRSKVQLYNRDDCLSALQLRDWLESLRHQEEERLGAEIPRPVPPEPKVNEQLGVRLARIREVSEALTASLPIDRTPNQQAQWILAQLLEWHRREDKVDWWEYFYFNAMGEEELLDERAGIAGLELVRRVETTPRGVVIDRYRFPPQDTDFDKGDDAFEPRSEKPSAVATVDAIDMEGCTVDLRKGAARAEYHPKAIFKHDNVSNPDAVGALLRLGEFVRDQGIDSDGSFRAARDLLLRRKPRLFPSNALLLNGESTVDAARRVVLKLDHGVLAIQGPPGTGKTYTGARMIIDLVRAGKKVGVTATSHKVIRNLLDEVVRAAPNENLSVRCMHRLTNKTRGSRAGIDEITDAGKAVQKLLAGEYDVVGGTAWLWSKQELEASVDVVVVDEAGQMSLANVLACAQATKSLVLLGDPQQLEQPQKASHPEGSELSALEYLLDGHETMPQERGLFLGETWRMHPAICAFTSELFYEGKLTSHPELNVQQVVGPTPFAGAGLFYVPVTHNGNQNSSPEEAASVAEIVNSLLANSVTWTNVNGETQEITLQDILIVTPYNAQVSEIGARIKGARVGTVDKFQGQEAPVVIYSTATSSPEDAPHGMEFLFSRHRLNVATSRARCVCILVGNPTLFEPECRTPEQMRMANGFCRYLELARVVTSR
jgi:predicted RecB family nuclease